MTLMSPVTRARALATTAHRGQLYGEFPYTRHLQDVWGVLLAHGFSGDYEPAAWLHDAPEDTEVTLEEIRLGFGEGVARLVGAVTTPHSIGNRKARFAVLVMQLTETPEALPLKLADRVAHARFGTARPGSSFLKMYRKEHPALKRELKHLSDDPRVLRMWGELDRLLG
jgi:guanosine-3',5'-bis(diphosphate) 3'-pyrophosphohydrolase